MFSHTMKQKREQNPRAKKKNKINKQKRKEKQTCHATRCMYVYTTNRTHLSLRSGSLSLNDNAHTLNTNTRTHIVCGNLEAPTSSSPSSLNVFTFVCCFLWSTFPPLSLSCMPMCPLRKGISKYALVMMCVKALWPICGKQPRVEGERSVTSIMCIQP